MPGSEQSLAAARARTLALRSLPAPTQAMRCLSAYLEWARISNAEKRALARELATLRPAGSGLCPATGGPGLNLIPLDEQRAPNAFLPLMAPAAFSARTGFGPTPALHRWTQPDPWNKRHQRHPCPGGGYGRPVLACSCSCAGNPFRGKSAGGRNPALGSDASCWERAPWPGSAVYGSPYLWQTLQAVAASRSARGLQPGRSSRPGHAARAPGTGRRQHRRLSPTSGPAKGQGAGVGDRWRAFEVAAKIWAFCQLAESSSRSRGPVQPWAMKNHRRQSSSWRCASAASQQVLMDFRRLATENSISPRSAGTRPGNETIARRPARAGLSPRRNTSGAARGQSPQPNR